MASLSRTSRLWKSSSRASPPDLRFIANRRLTLFLVIIATTNTTPESTRVSVACNTQRDDLSQFGLPVSRGKVARSPAEAAQIVKELGEIGLIPRNTSASKLTSQGGKCALKPQILRGGRAGGVFDNGASVHIVDGPRAAEEMAARMLDHRFGTAGDGLRVDRLFVAEAVEHGDAWHLAMTFDRERCCPVIVASKDGGVDIAKEQLHTVPFSITRGITPEVIQQVSDHLRASPSDAEHLASIIDGLYRVFTAKDATLIEINPLARSPSGGLTCLTTCH
ncbi:hypothetical protein CSOJ01_14177, partial [Colletotrichum sojae]